MSHKQFRILVSDPVAADAVDVLRQSNICEVDVKTGLKPDEFNAIIGDYDGLVVRSMTKVKADSFVFAKKLKVIGRAGAGVDNVDVPAATANGTIVMNTPGGNQNAVAELVLGYLFALARSIPAASASTKGGKWEKSKFLGQEIEGKTLGIVGLGAIGKIVARKAGALGMKVLGYDPMLTAEQAHDIGAHYVSLDDLLAQSDAVTIHVPLINSTKGLFNKAAFAKMKKGAWLIDAARGGIVVESDLAEALQSGHLGAAAMDVFEAEPTPADNPLFSQVNLLASPHIGASTVQAQDNVGIQIAHQIVTFLRDGVAQNAVNQLA